MNTIEPAPDTVEVLSSDIIQQATDAERAELYKHMAFEADKEAKRLRLKLDAVVHLVRAADGELERAQNSRWSRGEDHLDRLVNNARAALCKVKEAL